MNYVALLLHHFEEILHDTLVEALVALVRVAVGGVDLKDAVDNGRKGNLQHFSMNL